MRVRSIIKSMFVGLAPLVALMVLLNMAFAIEPDVQELDLDPAGFVHELNAGPDGNLWMSDFASGQLWQYDPTTEVYTVYHGLSGISDARPAPDGSIWWSNFNLNKLGHYVPGANVATTWPMTGGGNLLGLTFDDVGKIWATDALNDIFYSFDPVSKERCDYAVPDSGASDYILADGNNIWLGDWIKAQIVQLDTTTNVATIFSLTGASCPEGLTLDDGGNLWFADRELEELSRLDPDTSQLTRYQVPNGNQITQNSQSSLKDQAPRKSLDALASVCTTNNIGPTLLDYHNDRIWFTQEGAGTVGRLAPFAAQGQTSVVLTSTVPITPQCQILGSGQNIAVTVDTPDTAVWSPSTYTPTVDADGWSIFEIPGGGQSWGVVASDGAAWVTIQETQKLAQLSFADCYYLVPDYTGIGSNPTFSPTNSEGCGFGQFLPGEIVTVTAAPDSDWQMAGWEGTDNDASTAITNTVTMTASDHMVVAIYSQRCFLLTRLRQPAGSGEIPVAVPVSSASCSTNTYEQGEVISLTAKPADGWSVFGWEGTDNDASDADTNIVTMPALDHIVTVIYSEGSDVYLPIILRK